MTAPQSFLDGKVVLHGGDCRDVLRGIESASVDAVVTDPPYALVSIQRRFGKPGAASAKGGVYRRAAAGFMGKRWDTGDPFAGTGTTGQAALMEGMKAILIERSPEYVADIERRLAQPIQIGGLA